MIRIMLLSAAIACSAAASAQQFGTDEQQKDVAIRRLEMDAQRADDNHQYKIAAELREQAARLRVGQKLADPAPQVNVNVNVHR